jgi:hypothetical protein
MDLDLNIEVLEKVFGFKHVIGVDVPEYAFHDFLKEGEQQEAWIGRNESYYCKWCGSIPDFSSDLCSAYLVEEKIKEMGLERDYVMELLKEFNVNYLMVKPTDFYNIAHASAEDRCKAALAAVQNKMKQDAFLAESVERVKKHKYQGANPEAGCDKTFECCRRLGNEKRFGAFVPVFNGPGSEPIRCQLKFQSEACGYKVEGKR